MYEGVLGAGFGALKLNACEASVVGFLILARSFANLSSFASIKFGTLHLKVLAPTRGYSTWWSSSSLRKEGGGGYVDRGSTWSGLVTYPCWWPVGGELGPAWSFRWGGCLSPFRHI